MRRKNTDGQRLYEHYLRLNPGFYRQRGPHEDGTTPDGKGNGIVCKRAKTINVDWYPSKEITSGYVVIKEVFEGEDGYDDEEMW